MTTKQHQDHGANKFKINIFSTSDSHKGKWGTNLLLSSLPFYTGQGKHNVSSDHTWRGKHGHLSLVISKTKYAKLIPAATTNVPVTPYIQPTQPALFVPDRTAAVITLTR